MASIMLPIVLALLVGVIQFISHNLDIRRKHHTQKITSFAAGVSITYILLELFPTFTDVAVKISRTLYLSVLIGFITHHLIEKELYMHNKRHELVKKLREEENIFNFVYHIIVGIVLVAFINQSITQGVLFFFAISLFTFVSMLPANAHTKNKKIALLSTGTVLGTAIALSVGKLIPLWLEFSFVGLIVGILLFTIIRHHIPFGRKGRIGYFTLGFILYSLIIISSWYI